jgi:hypothetical protein
MVLKERAMVVVEAEAIVVEEAKVVAAAANANVMKMKNKMAITLLPPVWVGILGARNTLYLMLVHNKVKPDYRSHLPELCADFIDPDDRQFLLDHEIQELEEDMKKAAHTLPFFGKCFA